MSRAYVFADEAGCMTFSRAPNVSRYFVLCTGATFDCNIGTELLDLRRDLAMKGEKIGPYFHATTDKQSVRDAVFEVIKTNEIRFDATIFEKSKAQPQTRSSKETFYQYAWYYHFKHAAPRIARGATEMLITAASIGTNKGQAVFTSAVNNVVQQTLKMQRSQWNTTFPPSQAEPCLQVIDYVTWAIQRKWERSDIRSYDLIKHLISSEYDLWRTGNCHYY